MAKIRFLDDTTDAKIVKRNGIFLPEMKRVIESTKGTMVLIQYLIGGISPQHLTIGILGEIGTIGQPPEKGKYILGLQEGRNFWINHPQAGPWPSFDEVRRGIPIGYNGGSLARITNSQRKIVFEDEERIEEWQRQFKEAYRERCEKREDTSSNHRLDSYFCLCTNLLGAYGLKTGL